MKCVKNHITNSKCISCNDIFFKMANILFTIVSNTFQQFCSSEPWLVGCLLGSFLFPLIISLISSSFLSTKPSRSLQQVLLKALGSVCPILDCCPSGLYLLNCKQTLHQKTVKAMTNAMPHIRNRPQKLLRERRASSIGLSWIEHPLRGSHLSCILWSSPFSDSWRIAVDKSVASRESRWNA